MIAREIAEDVETVQADSDALATARLLAGNRWPGVVVLDGAQPIAVLPTVEVLRAIVPEYVREDPTLAGVLDEGSAARCAQALTGRRVEDLLPPRKERRATAAVSGDATATECAAVMARTRSPLLLVTDDGHPRGVITASHLLEILLPGD